MHTEKPAASMGQILLGVCLLFSPALMVSCDSGASLTASSGTRTTDGSSALGDDGSCAGAVGAEEVENLIVGDDEICTLEGTRITGNLFVHTNATLVARDIFVGGNIQSEGAALVDVGGATRVEGNVQIKQGGAVALESLGIRGDLQLDQNSGAILANGNAIGGNLQVVGNSGGVTLTANEVAENMQCKENSPPPVGGGNAAGDKEDQCTGL